MPKTTEAEIRALAAYGAKVVEIDEKNKVHKIRVEIDPDKAIELNLFGANLQLVMEAIAISAYEKGRWEAKQASRKRVGDFLREISE